MLPLRDRKGGQETEPQHGNCPAKPEHQQTPDDAKAEGPKSHRRDPGGEIGSAEQACGEMCHAPRLPPNGYQIVAQ